MRLLLAGLLAIAVRVDAHAWGPLRSAMENCPSAKTYDKLMACFARASAKPVREVDHAKLVAMTDQGTSHESGFVLVVEAGGAWHSTGLILAQGGLDAYTVTELAPVTRGGELEWRFEIEHTGPDPVDTQLTKFEHLVALCNVHAQNCVVLATECNTTMHGQTVDSFKGRLAISAKSVELTGNAGATCGRPSIQKAPYFSR
ncbi:MAG: hypothetical protein QM831_18855 [Kofleriaceae bacterium]